MSEHEPYQAMRLATVDIEPVSLCDACPKRLDCRGPASLAIDTYVKDSFFSISVAPGDPESFMSRKYVDADGNESDIFLVQTEVLINKCDGPVTTKRRLFKPNDEACGAHMVVVRQLEEQRKAYLKRREEERQNTLYLNQEEIQGYMDLSTAEQDALSTLPEDDLNELVKFQRKHPRRVAALRELAEEQP